MLLLLRWLVGQCGRKTAQNHVQQGDMGCALQAGPFCKEQSKTSKSSCDHPRLACHDASRWDM